MSSRRRERVGGGQTARATAPDDPAPHATTPPPIRSSRTEEPLPMLLRAQSANPQQRGQISASRGFGRATTAGARSSGSRHGGRIRPPREDIFLPPAKHSAYEAAEAEKFYTASTACKIGRIFSDTCLIQPSWPRVSTSPWGEAAKVCGGYGKRLANGTNSVDTPEFMYSKVFAGYKRDMAWKKPPRPFAYRGEANTAVSHDAPKFFRGKHTQVYGRPSEMMDRPPLMKIMLGRRMMAEPIVPETDPGGPLDWQDLQVTGRSSRAQ